MATKKLLSLWKGEIERRETLSDIAERVTNGTVVSVETLRSRNRRTLIASVRTMFCYEAAVAGYPDTITAQYLHCKRENVTRCVSAMVARGWPEPTKIDIPGVITRMYRKNQRFVNAGGTGRPGWGESHERRT